MERQFLQGPQDRVHAVEPAPLSRQSFGFKQRAHHSSNCVGHSAASEPPIAPELEAGAESIVYQVPKIAGD